MRTPKAVDFAQKHQWYITVCRPNSRPDAGRRKLEGTSNYASIPNVLTQLIMSQWSAREE